MMLKEVVPAGLLILITCLCIYLYTRLYLKRRFMPPGPTPLPLLGNILEFVGNQNAAQVVEKYRQKYGGIITLWFGTMPVVFICDFALAKEAATSRTNHFSGRFQHQIVDDMKDGYHDIVLEDFGPQWKILKKMSVRALRKFTDGEHLAGYAHESTNSAIERMLCEKKAFDPKIHLFNLIANVLSSTTFGETFQLDDPDFLALSGIPEAIRTKLPPCLPGYLIPLLKPFFEKKRNEFVKYLKNAMSVTKKRIISHRSTHSQSSTRDYVDAILSMQEDMKNEDASKCFTDEWLVGLITDIFVAGIDSTQITLSFSLLMMCSYPEIQERLRKDVLDNIGDRMPVQEDRLACHYIQAFISEILRLKRTGPFGVPRETTSDTELGGYKIPSRTPVVFFVEGFHMDETVWDCPKEFKPERFLDSEGRFISSGFSHYMPFGMGTRMCMGEKLARIDMFLVLAGLLQKCKFRLENGPGSASLEMVYTAIFNMPKPYKLYVQRILSD